MRRFAVEFSGAAEGLGYNNAALKDLFNSALDEPLSWWRMRGLDHLNFGQFVDSLVRSPSQVVGDEATAPPVAADGAAVPLVTAVEAAVHPGMPRLVCKLEDPPMRSVRAAGMSPVNSSPVVTETAPEPTESAPEPAPPREPTVRSRARSVLGADRVRSRARSVIIVSVAPAVSPSLPSFVSLYSLLVSAVLC